VKIWNTICETGEMMAAALDRLEQVHQVKPVEARVFILRNMLSQLEPAFAGLTDSDIEFALEELDEGRAVPGVAARLSTAVGAFGCRGKSEKALRNARSRYNNAQALLRENAVRLSRDK
jgi:hypothetical protein